MSFIVSFQGQFKPYNLPDLSYYDHIHHIYRSSRSKELSDKTTLPKDSISPLKKKIKNVVHTYQEQNSEYQKQFIPHHARDIMTIDLKVLGPDDSVQDAQNLLKKYQIHHIPILNSDNILAGIISDRDTIRVSPGVRISEIMTKEILTCLEGTRIQEISKIMLHEKISAIPIINADYKLTGIITSSDILNFMTRVISINQLI